MEVDDPFTKVTVKKIISYCLHLVNLPYLHLTCMSPIDKLAPAGKDLRTVEACEATFQEIDEVVGLEYLRVHHIFPQVSLICSWRKIAIVEIHVMFSGGLALARLSVAASQSLPV